MDDFEETPPPQRRSGYPRSFEKWGIDVVKAGYVLIPKDLIDINLYLVDEQKLTSAELMTVFIILSNWVRVNESPAASKSYIAKRLHIAPRQVQRILLSLEEKQVLKRLPGTDRTGYANRFFLGGILDGVRKIYNFKKTGEFAPNEHQFKFMFEDQHFLERN